MGLVLTNENISVSMSYFSFGILRQQVAIAFDKKVGELYGKMYKLFDNKLTKEENDYLDKVLPKYLDMFLYHSDCDGYFSKTAVKNIYKELKKLNVVFESEMMQDRYDKLLEMFSQGQRVDLD